MTKKPLSIPARFVDFGQRTGNDHSAGFTIPPIDHSIALSLDEKKLLDTMERMMRENANRRPLRLDDYAVEYREKIGI